MCSLACLHVLEYILTNCTLISDIPGLTTVYLLTAVLSAPVLIALKTSLDQIWATTQRFFQQTCVPRETFIFFWRRYYPFWVLPSRKMAGRARPSPLGWSGGGGSSPIYSREGETRWGLRKHNLSCYAKQCIHIEFAFYIAFPRPWMSSSARPPPPSESPSAQSSNRRRGYACRCRSCPHRQGRW